MTSVLPVSRIGTGISEGQNRLDRERTMIRVVAASQLHQGRIARGSSDWYSS